MLLAAPHHPAATDHDVVDRIGVTREHQGIEQHVAVTPGELWMIAVEHQKVGAGTGLQCANGPG